MTTAPDKVNGTPLVLSAESWAMASVHEAKAEAIRLEAVAKAEALRIEAEAAAQVEIIRATEEAEKLRLANQRAARRDEAEEAAHKVRMAELERKRAETQRQANAEAKAAEETEVAAEAEQEAREETAKSWKRAAIGFAVICALVALPVQMSAFYSPERPYLGGVPIVLEAGAWVVLKGAAAAVTDRRPHWHYRLIAWLIAAGAAAVNLGHGLTSFDTVTAIATAVASIAGPGVWDLHEHGRIRARDGKKTLRQRWAESRAAVKQAEQEAAHAAERAAAAEAEAKAATEAAERLAADRAENFPRVWAHALRLAAALGETTVTETIWRRAHLDIEGTEPGDSVEIIRGRNVATRRVISARSEAPGEKPVKVTSSQLVPHLPPGPGRGSKSGPRVRGIRRQNDAPKFVSAARKQAAITAKQAVANEDGHQ